MRSLRADNQNYHAHKRLRQRYFKRIKSVDHVHNALLASVRNQDPHYAVKLVSQAHFTGKEHNPLRSVWMVVYKEQALFPVFDESTQEIVTYLEPKHALRIMRRHLAQEGMTNGNHTP